MFFHGFRLPTLKNSSFFCFLALAAINRSFFQAASGKLLASELKCFVFTSDLIQNGQLIQNRRPIEIVDFLLTCLLRNAFFSRSAVTRTFALAFSNFTQPTRTR